MKPEVIDINQDEPRQNAQTLNASVFIAMSNIQGTFQKEISAKIN